MCIRHVVDIFHILHFYGSLRWFKNWKFKSIAMAIPEGIQKFTVTVFEPKNGYTS